MTVSGSTGGNPAFPEPWDPAAQRAGASRAQKAAPLTEEALTQTKEAGQGESFTRESTCGRHGAIPRGLQDSNPGLPPRIVDAPPRRERTFW